MSITSLQTGVDALWDRYAALAREAIDNTRLFADREHSQALLRAWNDWQAAYLKWGRAD